MVDLDRFSRAWLKDKLKSQEVVMRWIMDQSKVHGDVVLTPPATDKAPTYHLYVSHDDGRNGQVKVLSFNARDGQIDLIYYDLGRVAPFNSQERMDSYQASLSRLVPGMGGKPGRYGVIKLPFLANPANVSELLDLVGAALRDVRVADGRLPSQARNPPPGALAATTVGGFGTGDAEADALTGAEFDPDAIDADEERRLASIKDRRGQTAFRKALLEAYGERCAISGCSTVEVLEAAHIYPYRGDDTQAVTNGILLRSDLHTLFDLGLLNVEPADYRVVMDATLKGGEYGQFDGQRLDLPANEKFRPSALALRWRERQGASETGT